MFGDFGYRHRAPRRMSWRYRRWARRGGVMLLPPDDPIFTMGLVMLARWVRRNRSMFAPFLLGALIFVAAQVGYRDYRSWWPVVVLVTVAVVTVVGFPLSALKHKRRGVVIARVMDSAYRLCGLERGIERSYASLVLAVTGGWLSAAVAYGPTNRPLPAIGVVGGFVCAVPWWAHRRRRSRVRAERTIEAWPEAAETVGLAGSRIRSVLVDRWGWTARIALRRGHTVTQAIDRIPAIESGLSLRPGSTRVSPDTKRADRLVLRVVESDPLAEPIRWPGPPVSTVTKSADLGLFEDGQHVRLSLLRVHALIGGVIGSGKSGVLNTILANLTACSDVVVWGVDLKGGMELNPWADCLAELATTPRQAIALFSDALTRLNARATSLTASGERVWEPTAENPALVLVVDEYAEMPDRAREHADSIARRGRAVAVTLIAATQRPTQKAMGQGATRSQMDVRICLRVRERRDTDLILGHGAHHEGWHADKLTSPGTFLISSPEHTTPRPARAYRVTDADVARHVRAHAGNWPTLGRMPATEATQRAGTTPTHAAHQAGTDTGAEGPESALWLALRQAPETGVSVAELVTVTGMSRPSVYRKLRTHAQAGRVVQVGRGRWRAHPDDNGG